MTTANLSNSLDGARPPTAANDAPEKTEGFWNERRVRIAKIFGTVAVLSLLAAGLFFTGGSLALVGGYLAGITLCKLGVSMLVAKLILEAVVIFVPIGVTALIYRIGQKILTAREEERERAMATMTDVKDRFKVGTEILVDRHVNVSKFTHKLNKEIKTNKSLNKMLHANENSNYSEQERASIYNLAALTKDKFTAAAVGDSIPDNLFLVDTGKVAYDIQKDESGNLTLTTKKTFTLKKRNAGLFELGTLGTVDLQCVARSEKRTRGAGGYSSSEAPPLLELEQTKPVNKYMLPEKLVVSVPRVQIPGSRINPPTKSEDQVMERLLKDLNRSAVVHLNGQEFGQYRTAGVELAFDAITDPHDRIFTKDLSGQRLATEVCLAWQNHCKKENPNLSLCPLQRLHNGVPLKKGEKLPLVADIHFNNEGAPIINGSIELGISHSNKPNILIKKSKLFYEANARTGDLSVYEIADS